MSSHIVEIERKAVRQYLQVKHLPAGSYTRYTITLHHMRGRRPVRCTTLLYATGATLRLDRYEGRCMLWLDSLDGLASACTDVSESELRTIAEGLGLPLPPIDPTDDTKPSPVQAECEALGECLDALAAGDKPRAEACLQKADAAQAAYRDTP